MTRAQIATMTARAYAIDKAHSEVTFQVRHLLTKVRGRFTEFSGTVVVGDGPADSHIEVEMKTASIQTDNEQRDAHLKSGDFFEFEKYPVLTFRSTALRPTGGATFEIDGELTIRDVTRPVTLTGEFLGFGPGMGDETILAASAKTTIDRED